MNDRKTWERAVEKDPTNDLQRKIFADWLDEQGEVEEADRQRRWVDAFMFLADFTASYRYSAEYDEKDDPIPGTKKLNFEEVMGTVKFWAAAIDPEGPAGKEYKKKHKYVPNKLYFDTTSGRDELVDPETRKKFWKCFYIVTGIEAPEHVRNREYYYCSC